MLALTGEQRKWFEEVIVDELVKHISYADAIQWLQELLLKGHKGYENMSDRQILETIINLLDIWLYIDINVPWDIEFGNKVFEIAKKVYNQKQENSNG